MRMRVNKPKGWTGKYAGPVNVQVPGIDFGKDPILWGIHRHGEISQYDTFIVLKISGSMHWSGRGEQSYGKASFQVCKLIEEHEDSWFVERLFDFPLRHA